MKRQTVTSNGETYYVAALALALIYVIVTFVPAVPITVLAIMTMAVVLLKRKLSTNKIL